VQQFSFVSWNGAGADTFFQLDKSGNGMNASSFGTIDFACHQCADPTDLLCNKTSNWFSRNQLLGSPGERDGTLSNQYSFGLYR
jgi:hypothetical protein